MSRVRNENYIVIQGWMVNELKLKGNDLIVYAIIYGFSQTAENIFEGSLQYLADWSQSTKNGILKNLKSLADKDLIIKISKTINGVKSCAYKANALHSCGVSNSVVYHPTQLHTIQHSCIPSNSVTYHPTVLTGVSNSVVQGIQLSCTNNIDNNLNDNRQSEDRNEELEEMFFENIKKAVNMLSTTTQVEYGTRVLETAQKVCQMPIIRIQEKDIPAWEILKAIAVVCGHENEFIKINTAFSSKLADGSIHKNALMFYIAMMYNTAIEQLSFLK